MKKQSTRRTSTLRGQLSFRVLLLSLVAVVGLLAEIIIGLSSSLQGTRRQLVGESEAAALAFTKSLSDIESDLRATSAALTYSTNQGQVLRKALERQPAIFELLVVDPRGNVLAKRRRIGESTSRLDEQPWLDTIRQEALYLGPVDYSQFGVPFVDLAVAINDDTGGLYGTLLARTDFSALWNAVISLRIGETGYAYIAQDDGQILAYRDFQVVQRGSSLTQLTGKAPKTIAESDFTFYTGIENQYAIAAAAPVSATSWYVVIEQAVTESLFAFGLLTLVLLVLLVIVIWQASSAIGFTQRRIVTPLGRMQAAAEEIQQGNFGTRLEVHAEDELGNLAHTFNTMTSHIQGLVDSLEQRVAERTTELESATRQSQELATRLKAIADVGRSVSSIQDLDRLLTEITRQISNTFGFYHAGVFLIDTSGANAKLSAANSPGGQKMLSRGHSLKVGQVGIVGYVAEKGAPRIALDVGEDAVFFNNPDLPETRSEIALPLKSGEAIIGVLDVQSTEPNAFSDKDAETLSILADQVAIAIQNARLFDETRKALIEADALQRQYARGSWARLAANIQQIGYRYSVTGAAPLEKPTNLPEIQKAAEFGKTIIDTQQPISSMSIPLKLRGETIGVLDVRIPDQRTWEQDEIDVAEAIAERLALALENARLFEETTKRAARERTVSEITTKIRSKNDPESMIQTALAELRQILGASQVEILPHPESPTAEPGLKKST